MYSGLYVYNTTDSLLSLVSETSKLFFTGKSAGFIPFFFFALFSVASGSGFSDVIFLPGKKEM